MLRFLTAGESHGMGLTAIIEGLPAGLSITEDDINKYLLRRQKSYGRGTRMKKIEKDKVLITGGIRKGLTIGSPLALYMENKDWMNRKDKKSYQKKVPRPGHADLAGVTKYDFDDIQNVIERSSARETAIRTAVGAVASRYLAEFGIEIVGHVVGIGRKSLQTKAFSEPGIRSTISKSPVFCADPDTSKLFCAEIDAAIENGDTLGGSFEIAAFNLPPGLGSYVHWDRKLDGILAQTIMAIPSVKAVEVGDAVSNSKKPGSKVHDQIFSNKEGIFRKTNRAGGLEGGVTNGETLVVRGYSKPISSLRNPLKSVNLQTKEKTRAPYVRSDVCVVPAISVIAEAMVAWVLADCFVEKFGGDSIREVKENFNNYIAHINGK
jgi:chorismate synthase